MSTYHPKNSKNFLFHGHFWVGKKKKKTSCHAMPWKFCSPRDFSSPSSMHWCSPADRRHPCWASRRSRTPFGSKVIKNHSIDWNCSIPFCLGGYDLKQISSEIELDQKNNIASKYLQNLNISTHRHLGSKHFHCRVGGVDVLQHLRINGKLHMFGKQVKEKNMNGQIGPLDV